MSPPPLLGDTVVLSFPSPKVLVVRMNRPEQLNAMTNEMEEDLRKSLDWFEQENSLWVVIITGTGRLFCAGQDLKNWLKTRGTGDSQTQKMLNNEHGFGSLARRESKKTIICAMNGSAFGGGAEIIMNCDIVIAGEGKCTVCLPEVRRGVAASVGGIPNLALRSPSMIPYLLAGIPIPQDLLAAHVFTEVVPLDLVMQTALGWAKKIVECSPEAVWLTKSQINLLKRGMGVKELVEHSIGKSSEGEALYGGDNMGEGLKAFTEKRDPVWSDPKPTRESKL